MIQTIEHNGTKLAIVIPSSHKEAGARFFTTDDSTQQIGFINYLEGHEIPPHLHLPHRREVQLTQEVLFIRKGKIRVDFYTEAKIYLKSTILAEGDAILLIVGGHGFKVIEEAELIEVKQGPYAGHLDKERFESISDKELTLESNNCFNHLSLDN